MTPFNLWDWHYLEGRISTRNNMYFTVVVQSCPNLCNLIDCSTPGSSFLHCIRSLHKFMSIELVMPSNHFIICHPFSFCLQSFPLSGSFSMSTGMLQSMVSQIVGHDWLNSNLHIRWATYWSFSFRISTSNEYSDFISFRISWFGLLSVQGSLKSFL